MDCQIDIWIAKEMNGWIFNIYINLHASSIVLDAEFPPLISSLQVILIPLVVALVVAVEIILLLLEEINFTLKSPTILVSLGEL